MWLVDQIVYGRQDRLLLLYPGDEDKTFSWKMVIFYQITRCHIQEHRSLHYFCYFRLDTYDWTSFKLLLLLLLLLLLGARGGLVVKALSYNRQVAGSIPDGVIGIFQWHNPSGRTMALGSTQPLTEMNTSCISWGKGGWQPYQNPVPLSWKSGKLNFLETSGPLQACNEYQWSTSRPRWLYPQENSWYM